MVPSYPMKQRRSGHVRITRTTSRNAVHASSDSNLNNRPPSLRREYRLELRPEDFAASIRISFQEFCWLESLLKRDLPVIVVKDTV